MRKQGEPEHYHYDVRFITQPKNYDVSIDKEECKDFQWIELQDLKTKTDDISILRMISKTEEIKPDLSFKRKSRLRP